MCGKPSEVPPCRKHTARFCSRRCSSKAGLDAQKFEDTRLELAFAEILDELGVPYKTQHWVEQLTRADFFIEPDLLIYVDGDYWHSLPVVQTRDQRNNEILPQMGYHVLRFSETQVNEGRELVVARLEEEVGFGIAFA